MDRSLFFEEGCLDRNASILRKVPLFYKRPNLTEMNRVYLQLVTVTLSPLDLSPSEPIPVDVATMPEPEQAIVSVPSVSEQPSQPSQASQAKDEVADSFNPMLLEDACVTLACCLRNRCEFLESHKRVQFSYDPNDSGRTSSLQLPMVETAKLLDV